MIPYSIHVALLLAICLLFYKLLLQKETYYRLNRVVLLACLVLAFVLPLVPVPQQFSLQHSEWAVANVSQKAVPEQFTNANLPNEPETVIAPDNNTVKSAPNVKATGQRQTIINSSPVIAAKPVVPGVPIMQQVVKWAFWLYWCGVAAFGANLLVQVIVLLYQAYKKPAIHDGIFRIVELDDDKAPCSFGNNIFINPTKYDWDTYNQILIHEKVHIQQGHSFDLVISELMLVLQWFNPFAWLYRKELESNLEFLTDDAVLHQHHVERADYQLSLLKVCIPNFSMRITTNYNQSLLKKRIIMMNAKKSNVHTMWKYFMLMPLLVALVCGLNKPIAISSPLSKFQQTFNVFNRNSKSDIDFSHGTWFATIKGEKVYIQFQADENDDNHNWTSSRYFNLSDFPTLPKTEKADFTLTREAGTIVFNGKFDADQGIGHYKFTPNKDYVAFMSNQKIEDMDDDEYFSFFMADVKKDYVQFLKDNGFKDISRNEIMSMSYQKIDAAYIKYWKDLGYKDLTTNELVSLKSQKVDAAYVNEIRKAGYTDLTIRQIISFKQQHITGDYINSLAKASLKTSGSNAPAEKPTAQQIISSKNMHIDSAYVSGMSSVGIGYSTNTGTYTQLTSLKAMNITPEYVKSFEAVGLTGLSPSTLYNMKSLNITPEYVKEFKDLGYSNEDIQKLLMMKRNGVTPEYVKSFAAVGYKNIPVNSFYGLMSGKITPEDVKSYQAVGYGQMSENNVQKTNSSGGGGGRANDISLQYTGNRGGGGVANYSVQGFIGKNESGISEITSLKAQGITPEFIKGFQDLDYKDIPFTTFRLLKSQGITPELLKSFQAAGIKDIPTNLNNWFALKSLTPEYIKSFQGLGYKDLSLSQYSMLKRQDVTPEFVTGFNKLGFTDIPVSQLSYLKMSGLTPEFVAEMKQKGFDSKDLQKYIQLKNFNATSNGGGGRVNGIPKVNTATSGSNN
jgi:hypothetical protein